MYTSHSYPYTMNPSQQPRVAMPPAPAPVPTPAPRSATAMPTPYVPTPSYSQPMPLPPGAGGGTAAAKGPHEFPLLEHLSVDELQRLLGSDDKLNDIADDGNQTRQRQVDKEMAMAENRSLADFNLSRETRLREGRRQLAQLHEEDKRLREIYNMNRRQLESVNENYSLDAAKVMLETSATKTEDESEEIAELFMDGNLPLSDFLEQFVPRRMQAHIRRIKSDKMQELMKNTSTSTYQNVDIPMSTPSGTSASSMHHPPPIPPRVGNQAPPYQPGYPQPPPPSSHSSSPSWTPYAGSGSVPMPTLQAYPR